jgi:hypothetical protein
VLHTAEGRAATSIADALSLRLDRGTRLRFDDRDHVTLLEGSVYVDSGGLGLGPPLIIRTPAGDVRHIGTQFQVACRETPRASACAKAAWRWVAATRSHVRSRPAMRSKCAVTRSAGNTGCRRSVRRGNGPPRSRRHSPSKTGPWRSSSPGWRANMAGSCISPTKTCNARPRQIHLHGSLDGLDAPAMLERVALVTGVPLALDDGVLSVGSGAVIHLRLACCGLALLLSATVVARDGATQAPPGMRAGDRLDSVLAALNAQGHRIVYSSALVRPEMTLRAVPASYDIDELLREILAPWNLRAVRAAERRLADRGRPTRAPRGRCRCREWSPKPSRSSMSPGRGCSSASRDRARPSSNAGTSSACRTWPTIRCACSRCCPVFPAATSARRSTSVAASAKRRS